MGGSYDDRTRRPSACVLRALGLVVGRSGGLTGARLLDLRGELLELLGERGPEALVLGSLAVTGNLQLLGELLLGELLDRGLGRLHRLDLQRAVVLEAGGRRDQLADDDV